MLLDNSFGSTSEREIPVKGGGSDDKLVLRAGVQQGAADSHHSRSHSGFFMLL